MYYKGAILLSNRNHELSYEVNMFCKNNKINFQTSTDYADLIIKLLSIKPEIVFFDADTVGFDGGFIEMFCRNDNYGKFKVFVLSNDIEKYRSEILNEDIMFFSAKNFKYELVQIINSLNTNNRSVISEDEIKAYRIKLNNLLRELGITSKHVGYNYIKEIVIEIIKDQRGVVSLNQRIYPSIAMKYNTMVKNIERNIRNALNYTLKNCRNLEMMSEIKTLENDIPSNKQFITYLVDKIVDES